MCCEVGKEHILEEGKERANMGSSRSIYLRKNQEFAWIEMRDAEGGDEN